MKETMKMRDLVLYQFAFSHFNEKVRWGLDWKGLSSRHVNLLPGLHVRTIRKLSGRRQTPVLVVDGDAVSGSTAILWRLEELSPTPALFPLDEKFREEVDSWIGWLDDELGPATRMGLFDEILADSECASEIFTTGQPLWKRLPYRWVFPKMIPKFRGLMSITKEAASVANELTLNALDRIASAAEATGYLVGDRFTAADLTAASLLYPLSFPPESGIVEPSRPSAALDHWRARWAEHRGVKWMEGIYREHRSRTT